MIGISILLAVIIVLFTHNLNRIATAVERLADNNCEPEE